MNRACCVYLVAVLDKFALTPQFQPVIPASRHKLTVVVCDGDAYNIILVSQKVSWGAYEFISKLRLQTCRLRARHHEFSQLKQRHAYFID